MAKFMNKANRFILFALLALLLLPTLFFTPAKALDDFEFSENEDLTWLRDCDDITLVRFYEYGFCDGDYYLEIYLYNPLQRDIDWNDTRNNVQMAYTNDKNNVFRINYNKYRISFVDDTENSLFIRVKVAGFDMPVDEQRVYCISGIELVNRGDSNAIEYPVSSIYTCSSMDGQTTIARDDLPTCEVDVHHTFYRTDFSEKNDELNNLIEGWGNQLSSCYFSLPKNYSGAKAQYGVLEAITAEFYNYYTKPILITGNETDYNAYKNQIGVKVDPNTRLSFAGEYRNTSTGVQVPTSHNYYAFPYNMHSNYVDSSSLITHDVSGGIIDTLYWVLSDYSGQDFGSEDYYFSGDNLKTYFNDYSKIHGRDKAILDLFQSEAYYEEQKINLCDDAFSYGYNKHTYSISNTPEEEDDVFGFNVKFDNSNGWQKFWRNNQSKTERVLPLEKVDASVLLYNNNELSKKYMIDINEIPAFKQYAKNEIAKGSDVWLFRYDACEYYGHEAYGLENGKGFVAAESVYLDFDILSFRFNQDGQKYTIAVNHSPEDVWNDITGDQQPERNNKLLKALITILQYVLYVISGGIVVLLIFKICKATFKSDMHIALKIVLTVLTIVIGCALFGVAVFYINKLISYLRSLL